MFDQLTSEKSLDFTYHLSEIFTAFHGYSAGPEEQLLAQTLTVSDSEVIFSTTETQKM